MQAGLLDRRITILRAALVDDGLQNREGPHEAIATIWARKMDVSDSERQRAGVVGAEITTRFQVRSSVVSRAITPKDRIRYGARDYEITGIREVGRLDMLEITANASAD